MNISSCLRLIYMSLFVITLTSPSQAATTIEGNSRGIFINPTPSSAIVNGVGTNHFTWGIGDNSPPNSLSLSGTSFNTDEVGKVFELGELTYFNGTIQGGTEANTEAERIVRSGEGM